ncbi:hypothetical protein MAE02_64300 [Microvirga aerophila]|uniref:Uncharacterized protein n=1 Tax=Microvirga aerophila TaxID=670291 RepID=A0A512C3F2_9HYPH|nr:hypothetical protein MAE02_64300 [Microvirga aerophila]
MFRTKRRSLFASGLVAAPALELAFHVVQPAAQPFNGPGDVPDVIAGHRPCLIDSRHGLSTGLLSGVWAVWAVWAVWEAITLIAEAEGVAKFEVGAAPIGIPPKGWGILSKGRSEAEEADDKDHGPHRPSMNRSAGPVEPPQRR